MVVVGGNTCMQPLLWTLDTLSEFQGEIVLVWSSAYHFKNTEHIAEHIPEVENINFELKSTAKNISL